MARLADLITGVEDAALRKLAAPHRAWRDVVRAPPFAADDGARQKARTGAALP
jgi:hypothetical protein